jgi:hypothetical protein
MQLEHGERLSHFFLRLWQSTQAKSVPGFLETVDPGDDIKSHELHSPSFRRKEVDAACTKEPADSISPVSTQRELD